jgi:hypothetical protein
MSQFKLCLRTAATTSGSDLLLQAFIHKAVAGMEDVEIVDVLYVPLLKLGVHTEFLAGEMQCV